MMFPTSMTLRALTVTACFALATTCHAGGSSTAAVDSCSGTRDPAVTDAYLIGCSGDLALSHGVVTSDNKVVISGLSSLTLSDLRIVAPEIELRSDGHISLGSGVSLEVGPAQTDSSGVVTGGSVLITSGGHGTPTVYAAAGATLSAGGAAAGTLVVGSSGGLTILSSQQVVSGSGGTITGGPDDGSATSQEDPAPAESGGGALGAGASLALLLGIACLVWADRRAITRT